VSSATEPSLFGRLFDFSFTRFAATSLIKTFYVLAMVLGLIVAVLAVAAAFGAFDTVSSEVSQATGGGNVTKGLITLVLAPFVFFAYVLLLRLVCEVLIVLFTIAEDTDDIRKGIKRLNERPSV
jgi:hypothetical protein